MVILQKGYSTPVSENHLDLVVRTLTSEFGLVDAHLDPVKNNKAL